MILFGQCRLWAGIIIITLFKSQIILAEHECSTNWGDCKSNKSNQINQTNQINQIKCWFLRRGENRSTRRKTSRSRVENHQTQPTYDARSGNRTREVPSIKLNNHRSFWICVQRNHVIIVTSSISKNSILKIFSIHTKTRRRRFQIPPVYERFRKAFS